MRVPRGTIAYAALLATCARGEAATDDPFKNTDCKNTHVQIELDYCADRNFQAQDKKLNAVYQALLAGYDPKGKVLLKTAERNWLAYRDSECTLETAGSEGGSIQPMEYSLCLADKTKDRIRELQHQRDCTADAGCTTPN
jgi:uncharacterized protein YecT (DUF1311 family)